MRVVFLAPLFFIFPIFLTVSGRSVNDLPSQVPQPFYREKIQ
jgi:hypothetical protein